jgi:hypothetical protein
MDSFELYIGDKSYPIYYSPVFSFQALEDPGKNSIICITNHSRQWGVSWLANAVDNTNLLIEGVRW